MMKLKVKLCLLEKQLNEHIFQRKRDPERREFEKEFNIYTTREESFEENGEEIIIEEGWHRQYNRTKYDMEEESEDEKVNNWIKTLARMVEEEEKFEGRNGKKVVICFGCQLPIDNEEEKEKFENAGKRFNGVCLDCENERIDIGIIDLTERVEEMDEDQETEEQKEEEPNKRKREDTDEGRQDRKSVV